VGCVSGVLAGLAAAGAYRAAGGAGGFVLAALSGALAAAPGAVMASRKKAIPFECAVGVVMGAGGFVAALAVWSGRDNLTAGTIALAAVLFVLAFSAAVAAVHAYRVSGPRLALPAVVFAGMAGLIALAVGVRFGEPESPYAAGALVGALYGALLWGSMGLVRRLFGADVGAFRVQGPPSAQP
jgi:hypothetical protein